MKIYKYINFFYLINVFFYLNGSDNNESYSLFSEFEQEFKELNSRHKNQLLSDKDFFKQYHKLLKKFDIKPGEYSDFRAALEIIKNFDVEHMKSNNILYFLEFLRKYEIFNIFNMILLIILIISSVKKTKTPIVYSNPIQQNPNVNGW